jgi:hypothetical protein
LDEHATFHLTSTKAHNQIICFFLMAYDPEVVSLNPDTKHWMGEMFDIKMEIEKKGRQMG